MTDALDLVAVGDDLAFMHRLAFFHDRLLIYARPRIGAHELAKIIEVGPFVRVVLELLLSFGQMPVFGHNDLVGADAAAMTAEPWPI